MRVVPRLQGQVQRERRAGPAVPALREAQAGLCRRQVAQAREQAQQVRGAGAGGPEHQERRRPEGPVVGHAPADTAASARHPAAGRRAALSLGALCSPRDAHLEHRLLQCARAVTDRPGPLGRPGPDPGPDHHALLRRPCPSVAATGAQVARLCRPGH